DLRRAHIPLNASLRQYQYANRNGVRIPVPGGAAAAGQYNYIVSGSKWDVVHAWPDPAVGSTFIMWAGFTDQGPKGRSLLTFSQSSNPASPFYGDQTRLFSQKKSKEILFSDSQIASDPN